MRNLYLPSTTLAALILASACGGNDESADPFEAALPDTQVLTLEIPAPASLSQGLTEGAGEIGSTTAALVGEPADFYTSTYYQARTINLFGRGVLETLDAITDFPPTARTATVAVWGPFRDDREPNEFQLVVEARESPTTHFVWYLAGRPVSGGEYIGLAGGAYEPTGDADNGEELGRGWFAIDFDKISSLNPSEEARGVVAYAFGKSEDGVAVRVVAENPNEAPGPVAYAYGENTEGFGYILFAFEEDIHDGEAGQDADEGLVIRTRWLPDGRGRADVLAVQGDLGDGFVQVSQCWDDTFVSRYEALVANGLTVAQDGEASACVFDGSWPSEDELPQDEDLINPFASAAPIGG